MRARQVSISLYPPLVADLDRAALARGLTRSELVRHILSAALDVENAVENPPTGPRSETRKGPHPQTPLDVSESLEIQTPPDPASARTQLAHIAQVYAHRALAPGPRSSTAASIALRAIALLIRHGPTADDMIAAALERYTPETAEQLLLALTPKKED